MESMSTPDDPSTPLSPDTCEINVIFVHSRLDDYGLSTQQFRVFCHMARRAGRGEAYPAVATIAAVCRLHPQTVRHALNTLVAHRLLTRQERPGHTALYRLTAPSQWQPPTRIDGDPCETNTSPSHAKSSPAKQMRPHSCESEVAKGNPSEGNPQKEIHTPPQSPKGESVGSPITETLLQHAEEVYDAYPRKVGKPTALRAIKRAIEKYGFRVILSRTKLFAATCDAEPRFIPHPSTWFNQERFNDDPETWRRTGPMNNKTKPSPSRQLNREDYKQDVSNF
jgi:hypothetical protein